MSELQKIVSSSEAEVYSAAYEDGFRDGHREGGNDMRRYIMGEIKDAEPPSWQSALVRFRELWGPRDQQERQAM